MSVGSQTVYENQYLKGIKGNCISKHPEKSSHYNSALPVGLFIQPHLDLLRLKHYYLWLPGKRDVSAFSVTSLAEIHGDLYGVTSTAADAAANV